MNNLIEFAKNNRTTTHFRDKRIKEIKMAYRIMEYLSPDDCFPPDDIDGDIKDLLLLERFDDAYEKIEDEILCGLDFGCSSTYEGFKHQSIELMQYLLPIYQQSCTDRKERRKIELLKELKDLG